MVLGLDCWWCLYIGDLEGLTEIEEEEDVEIEELVEGDSTAPPDPEGADGSLLRL